jgi:RimJ/RimL family protein N-acetyltransferase
MMTSEHFITVKENPMAETKNNLFMTPLRTRRLLLKGLTTPDAEAFLRYRSLPEITRFQGFLPKSVEDAIHFIEDDICHVMDQPDTWFQLGIFQSDTMTLIGDLGIHFLSEGREVEIGVTIAPEFQGKGFAKEAVGRVLDFLFNVLQKNIVVASVDPANQTSMSLMTGLGFRLIGIYPQSILFRGEWADDAVFQMTVNQWCNQPKPSW